MEPAAPLELFVPGRLVANPTDPTAAYPCGGTALGRTIGPVVLACRDEHEVLEYEAEGDRPIESIRLGRVWSLGVVVRGLDPDALALILTSVAQSAPVAPVTTLGIDQYNLVEAATAFEPGTIKDTIVLMFLADNPKHHKSWLAYAAVPRAAEGHQIKWRRTEELSFGLSFLLQPDAARRVWRADLQEALTL